MNLVHDLIQPLLNGLLLGGVYGGIAIGLSLILGVLKIVNLAHTAILIFAGLLYWQLVSVAGLDPLLMIIPVVAIFFLFGMGTHRVMVQYLSRASDTTMILAFFGLMVILESIAIMIWTTDTRTLPLGYLGEVIRLGDLNISVAKLVAAILGVVVLIALHLFLTRTLTGSAIRGMAQNQDVATMVGINVTRLSRYVFAAGVAFAAFGGTILAMVQSFNPQEHARWLAWAFLVVILGGLGSSLRTLIAGLVVGVIESFAGLLLPFAYTYMVLYALLAVMLLVRNEGLGSVKQRTI